jgi:thiamine-phosphate pyrophosphorylase
MSRVDVRLYALVDPDTAGGHELDELAGLVVQGGATLVQLRDKHSDTGAMVERARSLKAALAPLRVPLLINDRVDVALACGAEGVHVGQTDMAVADARRLLGRKALIGLSIKTVEQARTAPLDLLDYVGIGGVFSTTSKATAAAPIGIGGLARVASIIRSRAQDFPVCAIAGITTGNASETIAAGADGVAVISALSLAPDPKAAAAKMRAVVDGALARRGSR